MTSILTTRVENRPGAIVVYIAGDLDYASAPVLRDLLPTLALSPGHTLVLNLADLTFCDSSGLTAFLTARSHALGAQAYIALAAAPPRTVNVLAIAGLREVLPQYPDTDAAISNRAA